MDNYSLERNMVKASTLYYKEGLKQSEIAKKMGISRSLVSKYLIDAREQGIVDIFIKSQSAYSVSLEIALEKKYHLKRVVVLDTDGLQENEIDRLITQTAINSLERELSQAESIGLSWGRSLKRFVDEYPYENCPDTTIVPLIGGMGSDYVQIHSNQLAYDLSKKMRAHCKYLYAPALIEDTFLKQNLKQNKAIKDVLNEGKNVDFAIVGLATLHDDNTMKKIGYINDEDIKELDELGAVGEINSRFYDINGNEIKGKINENVIGLDLEGIKKLENVATICSSEERHQALKIAIETNIVKTIVITDKIAEKLLKG